MSAYNNQDQETYVPVYDFIPEKWESARQFLTEQLRRISNGVNVREVGTYLEEQLVTGKQFKPGATDPNNTVNSQSFRTIFRKVINCSPLVAGANSFNHGITFNSNFTLIEMWVPATNSGTLTAINLTDTSVTLNSTQVLITSPGAYDRAFCVIEFIQEL